MNPFVFQGSSVHNNNLLYVEVANEDASLSFVETSGGLVTNIKSDSLNAGVSGTRQSYLCLDYSCFLSATVLLLLVLLL